MKGNIDPQKLRQQAEELQAKADAEDARRHQMIGKLVVDLFNDKPEPTSTGMADLLEKVAHIWTTGKLAPKKKSVQKKPSIQAVKSA